MMRDTQAGHASGFDDFERNGGEGAGGRALSPASLLFLLSGEEGLAREDVDDEVAFETGFGFGGVAAEFEFGAFVGGRYLAEGDARRRVAQFEAEAGGEAAAGRAPTSTRATPPAGIFTGMALRIFRGIRFMSRRRCIQFLGGDEVAVGEGLHHVFGRDGGVGDEMAVDEGAAFQVEMKRFFGGVGRGQEGHPHLVLVGGNAGAGELEAGGVFEGEGDFVGEAVAASA